MGDVERSNGLPPGEANYRQRIMALENALRQQPDQLDPDELTTHWFCEGVYLRQLRIPAGAILTGEIHRHPCINILLKGRIAIALKDGSRKIMEAPEIFVSEPGEKKAGVAITETLWLNVHATHETDLAKIRAQFIVESYEQLDREKREALEVRECHGQA